MSRAELGGQRLREVARAAAGAALRVGDRMAITVEGKRVGEGVTGRGQPPTRWASAAAPGQGPRVP